MREGWGRKNRWVGEKKKKGVWVVFFDLLLKKEREGEIFSGSGCFLRDVV